MQLLPPMYVGTPSRLEALVGLLSQRVAAAFDAERRSLPPWRTREAQLSKWALPSIAELAWQMQQEGAQAPPVQQALAMTSAALQLLTLVGSQGHSQGPSAAQLLPASSMMPIMPLRRHMSGPMDVATSSMSSSSSYGLSCFIEQELRAATSPAAGQADSDSDMTAAEHGTHNTVAAVLTCSPQHKDAAAKQTAPGALGQPGDVHIMSEVPVCDDHHYHQREFTVDVDTAGAGVTQCPHVPETPHPGLRQTPFHNQWKPQQAENKGPTDAQLQAARGSMSSKSFHDNHSHHRLMFDRQSSEEVRVSAQQRKKQQRSALHAVLQASGPLKPDCMSSGERQVMASQATVSCNTGVDSRLARGAGNIPAMLTTSEQLHQQPGNHHANAQDTLMRITKVKWGSGLLPVQPAAQPAPLQ